jgi:hypothetical protein
MGLGHKGARDLVPAATAGRQPDKKEEQDPIKSRLKDHNEPHPQNDSEFKLAIKIPVKFR